MINPCKDFLTYENNRNKQHSQFLKTVLTKIFGEGEMIVIGHHICYGDDIEIPSIDTLYFDHDAMTQLFGEAAPTVMVKLAKAPVPDRDHVFRNFFDTVAV